MTAGPMTGAVVAAFAKTFPRQMVEEDSDFFDLGGDSLNAEKLALQLSEISGDEVLISSIFEFPTPAAMAQHLFPNSNSTTESEKRPPIFMVHGDSGYTVPKKAFFEGLSGDQRIHFHQLPSSYRDKGFDFSVKGLARDYVSEIEKVHPEGPVLIAAFCNGSLIAIEMAHLLVSMGRTPDGIVLLDPAPPNSVRRLAEGKKAKLEDRVGLFFLTGRFSGGASRVDIDDDRLLRIRRWLFTQELKVKHLRSRITGHKAERLNHNLQATAALNAAFCHSWPDVYQGPVDLICSHERIDFHDSSSSFWKALLPEVRFHPVVSSHNEVTGASGPRVSQVMQSLFDKALAG